MVLVEPKVIWVAFQHIVVRRCFSIVRGILRSALQPEYFKRLHQNQSICHLVLNPPPPSGQAPGAAGKVASLRYFHRIQLQHHMQAKLGLPGCLHKQFGPFLKTIALSLFS